MSSTHPEPAPTDPGTPKVRTQRIDPIVVKLVLALEFPSMVMVYAILAVSGADWWVFLLTLGGMLIAPVLVITARLRVRLDDDRLRWSFVPFWFGSVAYDAIEGVRAIEVQAMRDYSGWGPKLATFGVMKGTFGAIARSGGAVRIERSDKKRDLVITCDDPDGLAAELLERAVRAQGDGIASG